jgi:hypothetical protein
MFEVIIIIIIIIGINIVVVNIYVPSAWLSPSQAGFPFYQFSTFKLNLGLCVKSRSGFRC